MEPSQKRYRAASVGDVKRSEGRATIDPMASPPPLSPAETKSHFLGIKKPERPKDPLLP